MMDDGTANSGESGELLEAARTGNRQAIERLLACNEAFLRQFIELRLDAGLRARVDASDVMQETKMEAVRRLDRYLQDPVMPFRLWLRQLANDRLLMLRRRHYKAARRSVTREVALPDRSSVMLAQQLLSPGLTPSQQASKQDLARR